MKYQVSYKFIIHSFLLKFIEEFNQIEDHLLGVRAEVHIYIGIELLAPEMKNRQMH